MAATNKIRKAAPEDLPKISSALSRAFFEDPLSARRGRLVMRLLAGSAGPAAGDGALRPTRWSAGSVWMERSVIVFTGLSFAAAYLIAALAARWPDRWRRLRCLAPGPGRYPAGAAASRQPGLT
jgi:hypothetical protein